MLSRKVCARCEGRREAYFFKCHSLGYEADDEEERYMFELQWKNNWFLCPCFFDSLFDAIDRYWLVPTEAPDDCPYIVEHTVSGS